MKTFVFYYIICFSFFACKQEESKLEIVLRLAGENREELEKVIRYYSVNSEDSLKLKAAKFLIENMPGHYTLESPLINIYRKKIDADTIPYFVKKVLDMSLCRLERLKDNAQRKDDLLYIKADFLIRHIASSFELLDNYPWLKDIPFELFLEYILPYRFENERIDSWRDSLRIPQNILDTLLLKKDCSIHEAFRTLIASDEEVIIPKQILMELFRKDIYGTCEHGTIKQNFRYIVWGMPSTIDCIFNYSNRNGHHYWTSIVTPTDRRLSVPDVERKAAKIYRKTFSHNIMVVERKNEYVPQVFKNPFYKDVTELYYKTVDITVQTNTKITRGVRHAYLCVFNDLVWEAAAVGNFQRNGIGFHNIGIDIAYLPAYCKNTELVPVNYPFILNLEGQIEYLIPNMNQKQILHLNRKYPYNKRLHQFNYSLRKVKVMAANQFDFSDSKIISSNFLLDSTCCYCSPNTEKAYRYWKITATPYMFQFAELVFVNSSGEYIVGDIDPIYFKGFDNNPLTNCTVPSDGKIIVDFGSPVNISKIILVPRSDGNGIYPNNEYELFYFDIDGWQSLGRKTALDFDVEFENVPSGALYWLRNLTTGVEERVFTYKNGRVQFW